MALGDSHQTLNTMASEAPVSAGTLQRVATPQPGGRSEPCLLNSIPHRTRHTTPGFTPSPILSHTGAPWGMASSLQELLCSFLRCLLRPAVVLGLMGPRGRVLALAQGKAGFTVGEEKGVEDKAGEIRAQPCEPQQGPSHLAQGWGWRTTQPHGQRQASPTPLQQSPLPCDLAQVSPALGLPD